MCVIFDIPEKITVSLPQLKSACKVNPSGYGAIVMPRSGTNDVTMHTQHYSQGGNDATAIATLLEEYKNNRILLHLRFKTAGDEGPDQCHPFRLATFQEDGFDLWLMHNGTLFDWKVKDDPMPDTFHFGRKFVKPMAQAFHALHSDAYVHHEAYNKAMANEIGRNSVVVLTDGVKQVDIYNKDNGYEDPDGWWSSNKYSFDQAHRTPKPMVPITKTPAAPLAARPLWKDDPKWPDTRPEYSYPDYTVSDPLVDDNKVIDADFSTPDDYWNTKENSVLKSLGIETFIEFKGMDPLAVVRLLKKTCYDEATFEESMADFVEFVQEAVEFFD